MPIIISINEYFKKPKVTELAGTQIGMDHWMNTRGTNSQIVVTDSISALKILYNVSQTYSLETVNFSNISNEIDYMVFCCHGNIESIEGYTADSLFRTMQQRGYKKCKEIHFYACSVGLGVRNFAQSLANEANVPVYAPANVLYLNNKDNSFIVKDHQSDRGWNVFNPTYGSNSGYQLWQDGEEKPPYQRVNSGSSIECVMM